LALLLSSALVVNKITGHLLTVKYSQGRGPTRYLFDPVLRIPLGLTEDALREHVQIYHLLLDRKPAQAARPA
jgi:hypothetical protein